MVAVNELCLMDHTSIFVSFICKFSSPFILVQHTTYFQTPNISLIKIIIIINCQNKHQVCLHFSQIVFGQDSSF